MVRRGLIELLAILQVCAFHVNSRAETVLATLLSFNSSNFLCLKVLPNMTGQLFPSWSSLTALLTLLASENLAKSVARAYANLSRHESFSGPDAEAHRGLFSTSALNWITLSPHTAFSQKHIFLSSHHPPRPPGNFTRYQIIRIQRLLKNQITQALKSHYLKGHTSWLPLVCQLAITFM